MEGGQPDQEQGDGRALSRELPHGSRKSPLARGTLAVGGRAGSLGVGVGLAGRGSPCCLGRPAYLCGHSHLLSVCDSWPQAWLARRTARWLGLAGADGPSFWSLLFRVGALGLEQPRLRWLRLLE